ncbi:MAG: glycosyltransferase family 2 protein [Deltaproteobacteria bacterium]|nr:glycosyltransferase family 2 protein [Deltaproteobacteria bacterium]
MEKQKEIRFKFEPKISVIVPVFNTPGKFFIDTLRSVLNQTYSNWELCLVSGRSYAAQLEKKLKDHLKNDNRVRLKFIDDNKGITETLNDAISSAEGEYLTFLYHDEVLAPFALFEVITCINKDFELDFIYTDEDKITGYGNRRYEPHFKPEWSPDTILSCNYISHSTVIKKEIIDAVGGFRQGFDGAEDYDLILRATDRAGKIKRIPKILYHCRDNKGSVTLNSEARENAVTSGKKAVADFLDSKNTYKSHVSDGIVHGTYMVSYDIKSSPEVSIIIPTKDKVEVLKRCISSVLEKTDHPNYKIVVVDNSSEEKKTFDYYRELEANTRITILEYNEAFNYSAINNYAVSGVDSDYIVLLNNDTEVINSGWLTRMLEHAQRKKVGAVGAKLCYPNKTVQHGGVIIGLEELVGHSHRGCSKYDPGYFGRLNIIQNLSAVTAACMMMRREVFEEVGGLDERYSHVFNDIDLCLKMRGKGYLIVYTPYAELYHAEALSRGLDDTPEKMARLRKEVLLFQSCWDKVLKEGDPYYNPNLTHVAEDFSINIGENQ